MLVRVLLPILVVLALVTAIVLTSAGEQTRAELDYLDEIKTQASDLARSGSAIREMMPRLREIDRDEFTTVIDGATVDVDVALAFVAGRPPVESLIPVWSLYRQAVQAWNSGIDSLSTGVLLAADQPDEVTATDLVADGLADLRAGDNLYVDLRAELERDEVPEPMTPLAEVGLSPSEGGLFSLAATYVAAARASTNNLGLRPDLRVSQVLADPKWELNVEEQAVVPFTETIGFSVVVTNVGNVNSEPQTLRLELSGGEDVAQQESTADVPVLRPGGQITIEFDPMDVDSDIIYTVTAELLITGVDTTLDDNLKEAEFRVNTG